MINLTPVKPLHVIEESVRFSIITSVSDRVWWCVNGSVWESVTVPVCDSIMESFRLNIKKKLRVK